MQSETTPQGPVVSAADLWQMPFLLWSGCLTQWLCLMAPHHPSCAPQHEAHDQLEVPEPIEEDGEHALFA